MNTPAASEIDGPATRVDLDVSQVDGHTDTDIERSAQTALQLTAYLLKNSVKVSARNGMVTLSGEVEWDYQRQTARSAVRYLPGVAGVNDEVRVRPLASIILGRSELEAARSRYVREEAQRNSGLTKPRL